MENGISKVTFSSGDKTIELKAPETKPFNEDIARKLAAACCELNTVKEEKKEATGEFNERIKDIEARILMLAEQL